MPTSKKIFASLFILSILAILFGEDGMIKDFSLVRFGVPFMFISFPFLLAYFLGWGKGFVTSIATSALFLFLITSYVGGIGAGEGWAFIYNSFFALFSLWYLVLACAVSIFSELENKNKRILLWSLFVMVAVVISWYIVA